MIKRRQSRITLVTGDRTKTTKSNLQETFPVNKEDSL